MRVIVTGASGFLGQCVIKTLTAHGIDAIGLSRQNVPGLVQLDSYADAPLGDALIHLAEASDRAWVNAQGDAYEDEAARTIKALLAKNYGCFVYASSAALYGDACDWPRRTDESVSPTDRYARIKYASEQAVLTAGGTVARLANLYGPGMSKANVLGTILDQLTQDGPMVLQDTTPVRDFLWIEDAAKALVAMVKHPTPGVFNAGSAIGITINDLATRACAISGQSQRIIQSRLANTETSTLTLDISETINAFRWQPSTDLEQGLRQLILGSKEAHA